MKKYILVSLMALLSLPLFARVIGVSGKVTYSRTGEPAGGIAIKDNSNQSFLTMTDDEGNYSLEIDSEGAIYLESQTIDNKTVAINDSLILNIEVALRGTVLDDLVVPYKGRIKSMGLVEEGNTIIRGNYAITTTFTEIPIREFKTSKRVILQPAFFNATDGHVTYVKPYVFDSDSYEITQERMYDWDLSRDSISKYKVTIDTVGRRGSMLRFFVMDSVYLEKPNSVDCYGVMWRTFENYNNVTYTDSFQYINGIKNPFRFLSFSLEPMTELINDGKINEKDRYIINPERDLRSEKDNVNLTFPVGKFDLDLTLGDNAVELRKITSEFDKIYNDPNMKLEGFSITGYASPEGSYDSNYRLASKRMESIMSAIKQAVDPSLTRSAKIEKDQKVAKWEEVIPLLRADSLYSEADDIQEIIDKYKSMDAQYQAIARLPFYKTLKETYLPSLRKVEYEVTTSRLRPLTDDEITEKYTSDPKGLSPYEFLRCYTAREGDEREKVLKTILEVYPVGDEPKKVRTITKLAAIELSAIEIARGDNPKDMLDPFFKTISFKAWNDSLPTALRYNMGAACLNNSNYSMADSVLFTVPDMEVTHKAKIYCKALNGNYEEVMDELSADSPFNEVLILLKKEDNRRALAKAMKLGDTAIEEYVKAMAFNRLVKEDESFDEEAEDHLRMALRLDPELETIAQVDGDVKLLYERIQSSLHPENRGDNGNNDDKGNDNE